MSAFNIYLGSKLIDTVFFSIKGTIADQIDYVRSSLINHDGYDSEIRVIWPKGQRVTCDYYDLLGDYGQGFEVLTSADTFKEIKQHKREYLENSPCPLKIVKKRQRI